MLRRLLAVFAALTLFLTVLTPVAGAADRFDRTEGDLPDRIADLRLDSPVSISNVGLDASLVGTSGDQRVIVRMTGAAASAGATSAGKKALKNSAASQQAAFIARVQSIAPGATVIAQTQTVLNAVFLEVDSAYLSALAADASVAAVRPVSDYELDLSETVPYIGGTAAQGLGYDGTGVSVAVLDSGVDYYHEDLSGAGAAAYAADDQNIIEPGTFPTAKVVGGYDFVGDTWPGGPEASDPDPLDKPTFGDGHGTHVADIIGGVNGVAPGADIVAVKVCSSVASSCSGIALIQGMEYAVDPNGDGDTSDAVDIINMSLGANYGQPFDDDLSAAVDNASAIGVLTVSSAGNGGDKPFVSGTPSNTSTALSVAQTQVPSATLQLIDATDGPTGIPAVFQSWSVLPTGAVSGPLQYGDGAGGNLNGCAPFTQGSLAGLVVLVDRGACNFTLKISNVSVAGGVLGIIGLVDGSAPFAGADGGDRPIDIPGYMIDQANSTALKAVVGSTVTVDPSNVLPLVGQMVGSSSRGPGMGNYLAKPDIGAPGASVSAVAGTGDGMSAFGGTSGASPMVAGAAALLLGAESGLSPAEVKARLVGTGETAIYTDPFSGLAPISRIGGGEVRVDAAIATQVAAWDDRTLQPSLSFGHIDVADDKVKVKKKVRVQNYGDETVRLSVSPTYRFATDEASGAVEVKIKGAGDLKIKPGKSKTFEVELTINGELLPGNFMNSGSLGDSGAALTANEFDGYVYLTAGDGETSIHIPWHVLPRQAAEVKTDKELKFEYGEDGLGEDEIKLDNKGVGVAQIDSYSLLGVSPNVPEGERGGQSPTPDLRAVGVNTFPVPAGFCSGTDSFLWVFAVNTHERQSHLIPVSHQITLDTNQDGVDDYLILNRDVSLNNVSDGRQLTWVVDLATGAAGAFFFAEHSTVTGNTMLTICGEQIGLTGTDILATNVDITSVFAQDFYYGGPGDELVPLGSPITITPLGEQYYGVPLVDDDGFPVDVPGNTKDSMQVIDYGTFPGNTPELGIMLVTNGDRGFGARGGATHDTEALIIPTKAARKYVKDVLKD